MSQPNTAGGHPTSFNTNVNRAKTKKWVEAKSYSYDGDDWGEVDEYDEYGGHDEPEPAPKRTGFRQRGQTATQAPQEGYGARQDLCQSPVDTRQPFGQMGGPPSQQPYGGHSATNPQPQHQPALVRTNSFDQGDERHAFSAEGVQAGMTSTAGFNAALQPQSQTLAAQGSQHAPMYSSQQVPAQPSPGGTRLQFPNRSSMDGQARFTEQVQSTGGTFRGPAYLDQQRQGSRTHSMTSNTSSQDFHNRRDFSPSAMPPPLQTRGSPSPHGNPDSRSSSRHPPRKSSLSQDNAPTQPFLTQAPPTTMAKDPEEDVPAASDRVSSSAIKPLPFVRPADIYKRMNEEKEKERQSQESSRPSMDSLTGKPNDRPTLGKISSDNESAQRLKPTLDPVSERRSEYGIEGINVVNQDDAAERRPTTSKKFELPKRAPNTGSQSSTASIGPVLPDVSRVSGFGESFFGSGDNFTTPTMNFTNSASQLPSQEPKQTALEKDLQHQPSLGFTSAVHHAFDKAEDQVPPTPSSATNSTIGRSASGGTSAVSPIISRGPSAATDRLPRIEDVSTSTIVEEPGSSNSRPRSSGSPDTPRQLERKPSLSQGVASDLTQTRNDLPPLFVPGHRRDLSTPSPDNSPARMPALEANRQLRQPEEVELSAATPIEQGFNISSSSQNSAIARGMVPAVSKDSYGRDRDIQHASTNLPGKFDQKMSPISPQYARNRTDSSSSSRVRNIADQFESGSRPGSAHSTTPRASLLSSTTQREDGFDPPRPVADRMASFRPHLPGGWESSASITPTTGAGSMETAGGIQRSKQLDMSTTSGPISTRLPNRPNEGMSIMASDNNTSSIDQIKDASAEAFTAAAAAGTALAGAFASAVGMDQHDSSTASASDGQGLQRKSEDRGPASRASTNTAVHPEASRPSFPSLTDDGMSGAAPTPLPRNIQQKPAMDAEDPEYFPSPLSVHQGSSKRASQIEGSTPAKLQPTLPLLSTDLQSQQYESDRLRKEIVRELTPMSASEPTTAETDYSNYQSLATNPSVVRPGRESGVLPREYESYWNDENSDEEVSEIGSEPTRIEHAATAESQQVPSGVGESLRSSESTQPASPAPLPQGEPSQNRPHVLPHRFSWEQPLHDLSVDPNPIQEPAAAPTSEFLRSAIYPEGRSFQPQDGSRGIDPKSLMPVGQATIVNEISRPLDKEPPVPDSSIMTDQETEPIDSQKGLTDSPTGLEVAQPRGERVLKGPSMSSYDEKISNLGPQSSIGGMDQREEPEIPLSEASRSNDLSSTVPDLHLPSTEPAIPPKIPAFREIVALKTASERVRGFNDARQQFARLKVGLDDWVAQTVHELPEHADILAMSGRPTPNFQGHRPSPSRSKLGGLLPGGGQGGQQPYFQQYLNASPQSPAPSGSLQGGAAGSVSPQASSPSGGSGGKISGQQVQAKGKDLLHTAGVFGGKANVAAKGLFSKGKSKFRAASGAEKATNSPPSPPSLSRGMQQQPSDLQPQPTTQIPKDLHDGPSPGAIQDASPNFQQVPRTPEQKFPRDPPSLESFSQSQLGDDERSEESGRTSQDNPPISDLHGKVYASSRKEEQPVQMAASVGDTPVFLHETPSAASYVGSPNEIPTPRSATSSNRTPTQATFATQAQPAKSQIEDTSHTSEALDKVDARYAMKKQPKPIIPPQSNLSQLPQPSNTFGTMSRGGAVPTTDTRQTFSGVYRDTFYNADKRKDPVATSLPGAQPASLQQDETQPQSSTRMGALLQSEVSQPPTLQTPTEGLGGRENAPRTMPAVSLGASHHTLRPSQEYAQRRPSIDGSLSCGNLDLPPSPMSPPPHQSPVRDALEKQSRPGPIHHGIDHDFISDGNNERLRNRSPSYSGSFPNRTSQDSRRSLEPNTFMDSAFWQSDQNRGSDLAANSYPRHAAGDQTHITRQPAANSQIGEPESPAGRRSDSKPRSRRGSKSSALFKTFGRPSESDQPHLPNASDNQQEVDPPVERRSESKPRSRRGSKSSPFFKAFGRSSEPDQPPLPNIHDNQVSSTPINSPVAEERKGRRTTLLRSLKSNSASGSGSGRSKENITPTTTTPQSILPVQTFPANSQRMNESPSRGSPSTTKSNNKLHRASTSGNVEQDGSKKKRFSAIGSLFGRSNPKRQSSVEHAARAPRQPSLAPLQQRDYNMPPPSQPQQYDGPPMEQPPPEGYYAPPGPDFRPPQFSNGYAVSNPPIEQNSWAQDAPAYVHDSSLRQRADPINPQRTQPQPRTITTTTTTISRSPRTPSSGVPHSAPAVQTSTSFPRTNAHYSAPSVPNTSSSRSREPLPPQSTPEPQSSGSSWTRFSSHSRSKSRNSQQPQPSSNGTTFPAPPFNTPNTPQNATTRQPFQSTSRSDSPPPPPLPPKDDWHTSRPRQSTISTITTTTLHHSHNPSQVSAMSIRPVSTERQNRPVSSGNRQSLPPLQTDVSSHRNSAVRSASKALTPEEKRRSRQQEIERSTLPRTDMNIGSRSAEGMEVRRMSDDEQPVMSATSFPGQMWQPDYAHWDEYLDDDFDGEFSDSGL